MHSRPANTESACWYIKKRRDVKAYTSLKRLRLHEIQAARDLYYIAAQIEVATLASFLVMIGQQMCGTNIIVNVAIMTLSLPASNPP
jgi:hypothetical protein